MARRLMVLVFAVSLVLSGYGLSHAAAVVKLKLANYFPPTHMNSVMLGKWCDELNKKLAGKVEITQYTGGTLLTAPKIAGGVATGIADIGFAHTAYSRGRFPATEIMELPVGFPSSYIATHVSNDFYEKFKPKEWNNYHPLMFSTSPPNVMQTLSKPVKSLEELKGMKIRGTGRIGDIVKALGATPVPIEMADIYDSLRRGTLEGNLGPLEQLKGWKTGEVQKYTTASWKVGSVFPFYVVMNKNKWNALPADVKQVITDHCKDFIERWAVEWNKTDIEGREYFEKQGGKIVVLTEPESARWVKAAQPVLEDYKKDIVSKGFKAAEVDAWLKFVQERIEYWKGQEKTRKVPTAYEY